MGLSVLTDGFPTIFGFGANPDDDPSTIFGVLACEKRLKPFGVDGGGPNDTTCMRNTRWRTRQPKKLVTLTEFTLTCSYDPVLFSGGPGDFIDTYVQVNSLMYIGFSDFSLVNLWGFVDNMDAHEITEGAQPEMDIKVCPTNQDDTGIEVAPDYTPPIAWTP